jgi:hypothetical protein
MSDAQQSDGPVVSVAHYRVKEGREEEFLAVVDGHWPTLKGLELVTDRQPEVLIGAEKDVPGPFVIEIFEWVNQDASARAHQHPAISGVWEAMGPLCESRGGRPPFEFPTFRSVR